MARGLLRVSMQKPGPVFPPEPLQTGRHMKSLPQHRNSITRALGLLALCPSLVFANQAPKTVHEQGTVKSVDLATHSLTVAESGKSDARKFIWNDATQFSTHPSGAGAKALKSGQKISLSYVADTNPPRLTHLRITSHASGKKSAKRAATPKTGGS